MKAAMLIGAALLCGASAWAADALTPMDVKPGLWQATVDMPGMPAMPNMPTIPPETLARMPAQQRAQIEAMMKGRGAGSGMTTNFCMSPDQIKRGGPVGAVDKSCTYNVVSSSASKQQMHMECKQGATTSSGDVTVERADSEHITATAVMKTSASDKPMTVKTALKWLAADCGDVKPAGAK